MIGREDEAVSLRPSPIEVERLAWVFVLSILLHAIIWGGYEGGKALGIWDKLQVPAWLKTLTQLVTPPKQEPKPLMAESEPPLMFVEVNPNVSTAEAPKDAKYYSDKNSQAANPEADADTGIPKISGRQEHVPKTDDVQRNDVNKLQPSRPAEAVQEASKPKSSMAMGDLALAKPDTLTRQDDGQAERQRPRTVQEALTRQQLSKIPGEKMKQEGGVRRKLDMSSFDTRATPFGAYDAALIEAVTQRWFNLLDMRGHAGDSVGRVVLQFRLNYNGDITDMKVLENTVGETLGIICQKAVQDPAPFEKWPGDMRRMMGDTRSLQFTFYYN